MECGVEAMPVSAPDFRMGCAASAVLTELRASAKLKARIRATAANLRHLVCCVIFETPQANGPCSRILLSNGLVHESRHLQMVASARLPLSFLANNGFRL